MAHMLHINDEGKASMAFTGSRNNIWHGLGQELAENAPIEVWRKAAGMEWEVLERQLRYDFNDEQRIANKKKALIRSDTGELLGIVGHNYNIVQPQQVLEFFRDLVSYHGLRLSTAGVLFNGERFWALADTSMSIDVFDNDRTNAHLLLTTSADGTTSTQAMFTAIRVVCNNTMNIALNDKSGKIIRVTHKSQWDPERVKIDLGIMEESWESFMSKMKSLTEMEVPDNQARKYFQNLEFNPNADIEKQTTQAVNRVNRLDYLYRYGAGAESGVGTAYGVLNAVTNLYTHGPTKTGVTKNPSRAFWNSNHGGWADKKVTAFNTLIDDLNSKKPALAKKNTKELA